MAIQNVLLGCEYGVGLGWVGLGREEHCGIRLGIGRYKLMW
jgi:hypothetical protein